MGGTWNQLKIKPSSKAKCLVKSDMLREINCQLNEAVDWCLKNNKCGWAVINFGLFLLIKDIRTINKCLDGEVVSG